MTRKKESRALLWAKLRWLQVLSFHARFKWYIYPTLIFLFAITYQLAPEPTIDLKEHMPLEVKDLIVCEHFSYVTREAGNCNHVFEDHLPGVFALYTVNVRAETEKTLYIKWYKNGELIHTAENAFEQDGRKVPPGEYLLATPTAFPFEVGVYQVELHVDDLFMSQSDFTIIPKDFSIAVNEETGEIEVTHQGRLPIMDEEQ